MKWLLHLIIFKAVGSYEIAVLKIEEDKRLNGNAKKQTTKLQLERALLNTIKDNYTSVKNLIWLAEESGYNLETLTNSLIEIKKKNVNDTQEVIPND